MWRSGEVPAEKVPGWFPASCEAFRAEVLHPEYPCYFATLAEREGTLYYTWVEGDDVAHLPETLARFNQIADGDPGRRYACVVFGRPETALRHADLRVRFWRWMRGVADADPCPRPHHLPADPEDPLWEMVVGGTSYFVFAAAPTHRRRRSRHLGPGLVVFFQPRSAFRGVEAGTPAGARARATIRQRLTRWDGRPPHPDLADFGDPAGREWKQTFLPDDNRRVAGRCPLSAHGPPPPAPGVGRDRAALPGPAEDPVPPPPALLTRERLLALPPEERSTALAGHLRVRAAQALRLPPDRVGAGVGLADLGLDSLAAIELAGALTADFGVSVPLPELLAGPALGELAGGVLERLAGGVGAGDASDVSGGEDPLAAELVADGPAAEGFPLSAGQRALWFLERLAPTAGAYNIATAVRLRGALDPAALLGAFAALALRHPCLRTTFHALDGTPLQRVRSELVPESTQHDAAGWSTAELGAWLSAEAARPFDLERGPLWRVALLARDPGEHVLLLAVHHLVADFWSLTVLAGELSRLYGEAVGGPPADLAPLVPGYPAYVRWQRALLAGPGGEALWTYWRDCLTRPAPGTPEGGGLPELALPADRPRPAIQTYAGAARPIVFLRGLAAALRGVARREGATLYTALLAGFFALLGRHTGQDDLLCGSPAAGRRSPALADQVGYYVNPLVLRADLAGDPTFATLLGQLRTTVVGALEHQDFPFALLAERLHPVRDASRPPLVQVLLIVYRDPAAAVEDGGLAGLALGESEGRARLGPLAAEPMALPERRVQFELTLVLAEVASELCGSLQYNTDLFDAATAERLAGRFAALLAAGAAHPGRRLSALPVPGPAERHQLLFEWNDTGRSLPPAMVWSEIAAQVRRTGTATALISGHQTLDYAGLDERVQGLARHLRTLGVGPEEVVGIHLERTVEMVVALLAVLAAGGAYLPLDPAYPAERLTFMLDDAGVRLVLATAPLAGRLAGFRGRVLCLDELAPVPAGPAGPAGPVAAGGGAGPENLAYVNYTSGSTGRPKGVLVSHRAVVNFFRAMDERVGCSPDDTLLAVTSISFDISVLELLWTLARGARVVLLGEDALSAGSPRPAPRPLDLSLFYFASAQGGEETGDRYRLLLEGAQLADRAGFAAVWTPERHFHDFGGLYPNPAVTSAALATVTRQVALRAGSVVLPLHNPLRVAEEWAVVDNLSGGRVGIAFASGWHADDFVFAPDAYADRKEEMYRGIATVQALWRGETVRLRGGAGNEVEVRVLPRPLQPELPVWITAAGSADTFVRAGEIGAHLLTHLLGQTFEEVAEKVRLYRAARERAGHDPATGIVTLMLHTFVGDEPGRVRDLVRVPFTRYLRSSVGLIHNLTRSLGLDLDLAAMSPRDLDDLLAFAFERYYDNSALFGDAARGREVLDLARQSGVDEVACLVDFGIAADLALAGIERLAALPRERRGEGAPASTSSGRVDRSLAAQARRWRATLLQCTPSTLTLLGLGREGLAPLAGLRALLLGGEALPPALAARVRRELPARLLNVYGPTETTVWSALHEVGDESFHPASGAGGAMAIGRPLANTSLHVLDAGQAMQPLGVPGELWIGGTGLARGYHRRPDVTAERFRPDPFGAAPGGRLYRTGDLVRRRPDGALEYLGRLDQQVKVRGFRIELGEIEALLAAHPAVREAVVVPRPVSGAGGVGGDGVRLVAWVVPAGPAPSPEELRAHLAARLPETVVPQSFVCLAALPRTPNQKIDRRALPDPDGARPALAAGYVAPQSEMERAIAALWCEVLGVERVGVRDNFFDLGGHSLLMAEVHARLRERLAIEIALVKLLEHPTVGALAAHLAAAGEESFSRQDSELRARRQMAERARRQGQARLARVPS